MVGHIAMTMAHMTMGAVEHIAMAVEHIATAVGNNIVELNGFDTLAVV